MERNSDEIRLDKRYVDRKWMRPQEWSTKKERNRKNKRRAREVEVLGERTTID